MWKGNKKEVIEVSLITSGVQKAERAFLLSLACNGVVAIFSFAA